MILGVILLQIITLSHLNLVNASPFLVANQKKHTEAKVFQIQPQNSVLKTLEGEKREFFDLFDGADVIVVAVRDFDCPVSKSNFSKLKELENSFSKRAVNFYYISAQPGKEAASKLLLDKSTYGLKGEYLVDELHTFKRTYDVQTTTTVMVFSSDKKLVYTGAIDDQFGIGVTKAEAKHFYLLDAIESTLNQKLPKVRMTSAPGCFINTQPATDKKAKKVYFEELVKVFEKKCTTCHSQNGNAPFSLVEYKDFVNKQGMIDYVVDNDIMPPWSAKKGLGPWRNDMSLSATEKKDMLNWLRSGLPKKTDQHLSVPVQKVEWRLGKPDLIISLSKNPQKIPATGVLRYRYEYINFNSEKKRYIRAVELLPTNYPVAHHISATLVEPPFKKGKACDMQKPLIFLGKYLPSIGPLDFGDYGFEFPQQAFICVELHYTPNGVAGIDEPRIGIYFHKNKPKEELKIVRIWDREIDIPPNAKAHSERAEMKFETPITLLGVRGHMHLRGKSMSLKAQKPGELVAEEIFGIENYNFYWQLTYFYENPLSLPKGTVLKASAIFDNSKENPFNPDHTKEVKFGLQFFDEMFVTTLYYVEEKERVLSMGLSN